MQTMIEFSTSFTVFPNDCNYAEPSCVFGGKMLAEMDNCAAMVCRRALYDTECTDSVTVHVEIDFSRPAFVGDIVLIKGWLAEVGNKSLTVKLQANREEKRSGNVEMMAKGIMKFVGRKNGTPYPHGLIFQEKMIQSST